MPIGLTITPPCIFPPNAHKHPGARLIFDHPGRVWCVRPLSSPASASKKSESEWISAGITNTCLVIGPFVLAVTSHPDASCEGNPGDVKL